MTTVVVTGMGVISPIGNSVEEAWANAKAGRNGIDQITQFDPALVEAPIAGEVKNFDPVAVFGHKEARRMDRAQHFALYAAQQALDDSGLKITAENAYDIGCIIGTGAGGLNTLTDGLYGFRDHGHRGVNPVTVPPMLHDSIAARISIELGIRGANFSITTACATGNNSIGEAVDKIRLGRLKAALVGATEAPIAPMIITAFTNLRAMSRRADDPEHACRPFDLNRDGFVPSEGAAVVVLEELDHALARGAKIYGVITGYGHTSDAYHVTAPREDAEGAVRSMQDAMREAGLGPEDIDYVNAHGTSTKLNDRCETLAIKTVLGERAYNIPISSTKSMTGHMLGAAGAIETIFSLLSIRDNFIPPTINYDTPDPDCDLDCTPNVGREHPINTVLNYSAGFGGHNVTLIVQRYNGN